MVCKEEEGGEPNPGRINCKIRGRIRRSRVRISRVRVNFLWLMREEQEDWVKLLLRLLQLRWKAKVTLRSLRTTICKLSVSIVDK